MSHLSRSVLILPVSFFCTASLSQRKSCTLCFLQLFQLSVKEYTVLSCMSGLVWNPAFWWENTPNGFTQILADLSFKIVTNPALNKMTQASWGFSNFILWLLMPTSGAHAALQSLLLDCIRAFRQEFSLLLVLENHSSLIFSVLLSNDSICKQFLCKPFLFMYLKSFCVCLTIKRNAAFDFLLFDSQKLCLSITQSSRFKYRYLVKYSHKQNNPTWNSSSRILPVT